MATPSRCAGHLSRSNVTCRDGDGLKHSRHVFDDIGVPKAKDDNASGDKPGITALVTPNSRSEIVLTAVKLDRETQFGTIEIKHIWSGRVLSPEAMAIDLSPTQPIPETPFDHSRVLAQATRLLRLCRRSIKSRQGHAPLSAPGLIPTRLARLEAGRGDLPFSRGGGVCGTRVAKLSGGGCMTQMPSPTTARTPWRPARPCCRQAVPSWGISLTAFSRSIARKSSALKMAARPFTWSSPVRYG
jgi:hypothetical protein